MNSPTNGTLSPRSPSNTFLAHCSLPPIVLPNHPCSLFVGKQQHQNISEDESARMNEHNATIFGKGLEWKVDLWLASVPCQGHNNCFSSHSAVVKFMEGSKDIHLRTCL